MDNLINLETWRKHPNPDPYYDDDPEYVLPRCIECSTEDEATILSPIMDGLDAAPDEIVGLVCLECGMRIIFDDEYFGFKNTGNSKLAFLKSILNRLLIFCGLRDYC